ncbi:MAG TPA: PilZ domain-containing protein [Dissulfurispiraceae bacterium]|nr:PilZ domain-containing protein [Dissulfurispiraceae bacterium]
MNIGEKRSGHERREAYRVDGEVLISYLKHDDCKKCGDCFKDSSFVKQSVNISEKGMRFYTDKPVSERDEISVAVRFTGYALPELHFPDQCLIFHCRVLRVTRTERGNALACAFLPANNRLMISALSKYIFNRQREELTGESIEDTTGYVVKKK